MDRGSVNTAGLYSMAAPAGTGDGPSARLWDSYIKARQHYTNLSFEDYASNPDAYPLPQTAVQTITTASVDAPSGPRVVGPQVPKNYRGVFNAQYIDVLKAARAETLHELPNSTVQGFFENAARILSEVVLTEASLLNLDPANLSQTEGLMLEPQPGVYTQRPSLSAQVAYRFLKTGRLSFLTESDRLRPELRRLEEGAMHALANAASQTSLTPEKHVEAFRTTVNRIIPRYENIQRNLTNSFQVSRTNTGPHATASRGPARHNIFSKFGDFIRRWSSRK